jgi:8-oxo-dGTP pyrophosphatase MutT (NUDIX family)
MGNFASGSRLLKTRTARMIEPVTTATQALALLAAFDPGPDRRATRSLEATIALLRHSPDPFSRSAFDPGHLTASGIVLSADGQRVLLVYHRRLRRWLQPGGHVEPEDPDLVATARREIQEETGVALDQCVPPVVVGVQVHRIPPRTDEPAHLHHDVAFRFVARPPEQIAPEVGREVVWCAIDRLAQYQVDRALERSVERAHSASPPQKV